MCVRVPGAVPVQVMTARTPVATVVLGDRDLEVGALIGHLDGAVGATDRQLPAHVRLDGEGLDATEPGVLVQRATGAAGKTWTVQEDAGTVDDAGLELTLFLELPSAALAGRVELPLVLTELGNGGLHPRYVVLVREVRAQGAATVIRAILIEAGTTAAEDAGP